MAIRAALCALGSLLALSAQAQGRGYYLGIGVGQGEVTAPPMASVVFGTPVSASPGVSSDTSFKLYGGFQLSPALGLEMGYADLGSGYTSHMNFGGVPGVLSFNAETLYVAATGTLALGNNLSVFGKLGFAGNRVSAPRLCLGGLCHTLSDTRSQLMGGLGLQYEFMPRWTARLEYEDYGKLSSDDVWLVGGSGAMKGNSWYLNAHYHF